jgi:hypothetical protein
MDQNCCQAPHSGRSSQKSSFGKTVCKTGITATLVAIASYSAYRIYKNKMAKQTIEGKITTASNILTEISKDTFIINTTEAENDSNLTLQAAKIFAESQFSLILAQNYLVAQAAQLAVANRCITEADAAIKNALENKKTTEQEKDRLNKRADTCHQIKEHIATYNDSIDKKLIALLASDGYEVQLALYAQADAVHRDGWWKGVHLITYSLLAVIGMIVAYNAATDIAKKNLNLRQTWTAHALPLPIHSSSSFTTSNYTSKLVD